MKKITNFTFPPSEYCNFADVSFTATDENGGCFLGMPDPGAHLAPNNVDAGANPYIPLHPPPNLYIVQL